ncbi:hypothetical protein [Paenibacillus durus]|nr:hypothetical protein [Paenibacillus durus]
MASGQGKPLGENGEMPSQFQWEGISCAQNADAQQSGGAKKSCFFSPNQV